jgi:hypothetical protein
MAFKVIGNLDIENARLIFKNFKGEKSQYNRAGDRNFGVILDYQTALKLQEDGWNVKIRPLKDGEDEPFCTMQVAVSFANIPPVITMIKRKGSVLLTEDTVDCLDFAEIKMVDLTIRPYNWTIQEGTKEEKSGVKAYLKEMFVTIEESAFADKYNTDMNE